MHIFFGTIHLGTIARHKKQSVKTRFFFLFVFPLFPVQSVYVTEPGIIKHKGRSIPLNKKSVVATYARFYLFAIAVLLWLSAMDHYSGIATTIFAVLTTLAWLYFMFWYGKADTHEKELRNKLGWSTGMPMLPYWLDSSEQLVYLRDLEFAYDRLYGTFDWQKDVRANTRLVKERPLLYALAVYNYLVFTIDENNRLLDQIALSLPAEATH